MQHESTPINTLPKCQQVGYPQADVKCQLETEAPTLYRIDLDEEGRSLTDDRLNVWYRLLTYLQTQGAADRIESIYHPLR